MQNVVDVLWESRAKYCFIPDYEDGIIPAEVVTECKRILQKDVEWMGISLEAAERDAEELKARRAGV